MANYRVDRVKHEIQKEINDILRNVVKDPRVEGITLTDLELSSDLQYATIYYSSLSELKSIRDKEQQGLEKATGVIRREIGKRIRLYKVPELKFKRDESVDYGNHIDELIRKMNEKQ